MATLLDNNLDPKFRVRDVSTSFTYARMEEAPVATMIKKGAKPKSTLYEWPFKTRHSPSDNAIGETSARLKGTANLSPALTGATRLSDVAGARNLGISKGVIQFSFNGGPTATVDRRF